MIGSEEDFVGHQIYWVFAGLESIFNGVNSVNTTSTNKYLVPVESLNVYSYISDIKYVPTIERLYFLTTNQQKTIYSQYFPDAQKNKRKNVESLLNLNKIRFENNSLDKVEFEDFRILKIANSRNSLFAIAKDANQKFFIIKLFLDQNGGFDKSRFLTSSVQNLNLSDETDCDFFVHDINEYESDTFVFLKSEKKVLTAKFRRNKKSIILSDIMKSIDADFSISAFCLLENSLSLEIAMYESTEKHLRIYKKSSKHTTFELKKMFSIESKDFYKIAYFSFDARIYNMENIYLKSEVVNAETNIILLFSNHKIKQQLFNPVSRTNYDSIEYFGEINFVNVDTGKYYPLIGQGKIYLDHYFGVHRKLIHYKLPEINVSCVIPGNAIFFGNAELSKVYALLMPKARDIFFSKVQMVDKSENDAYDKSES